MTITSSHEMSLEAFKLNDMKPFFSYSDNADTLREQAHALLVVLSSAFRVVPTDEDNDLRQTNRHLIASALDGVASLVSLSQFNADCAHAQRSVMGDVQ